jgi:hypothetical protein
LSVCCKVQDSDGGFGGDVYQSIYQVRARFLYPVHYCSLQSKSSRLHNPIFIGVVNELRWSRPSIHSKRIFFAIAQYPSSFMPCSFAAPIHRLAHVELLLVSRFQPDASLIRLSSSCQRREHQQAQSTPRQSFSCLSLNTPRRTKDLCNEIPLHQL